MPRTSGPATRQRVVDSALRLFGSYGYAATSLDDVAAAAGIRKQSLLYYFGTKDSLMTAAAISAARSLFEAMESALASRDSQGLGRLDALVGAAVELSDESPEIFGLIGEVARIGPPVSDRVVRVLRPLMDSAVAWLESEIECGTVRPQDPRVALLTIYSAVMGHLSESVVSRVLLRRKSHGQTRAELISFLRAALSVSSRSDP